ncbi:MAG: M4 family metallopeptidase, partial [Saprospiraceae bacterium]
DYENQSGALNESFADVFGSLIERKNFLIGEDVSNPAIFPTGALRDMLNPNNGGSGPNDPGWQPKHMNEFQTLPNTPAGDNGGVHVNSGIPNRAFALIATAIGKDKAEQIYYHALKDYLVKSSQFVDMRNAAEKAAEDLHGAGSTEVMAIKTAFDAVGIGAGQGDDHQGDIQTGTGSDFIIVTDDTESDLYWVPPSNPSQFVKMNVPAPISRPSFTDDGTACVYIDNTNNMILLTFDWSAGLNFQKTNIENNPQGIWRNIVASKDGSKIAYTTSNLTNEIWVYDFNSSSSQLFTLYNPTTAQGQSTGDVEYPDAMEWDYSGEFVMYDALNKIGSSFGDGIEYWDISFLKAWDNQAENFGLGQIDKLFSSLAENVSIGNPSFAKNSPYIITFDYLETTRDNFGQEQTDYRIKAANIEAGIVNDIFQNTTIGYPSYSRLDNQILFTYDDAGTLEIATINLQANDKTLPVQGSGLVLLTGAQKGVWFQTGTRIFTGTKEIGTPSSVSIFPQPTTDEIRIASGSIDLNRSYTISDLTGGLLIRGNVGKTGSIDVSSLSPGMYVLETIGKTGLHDVAKFVKQ